MSSDRYAIVREDLHRRYGQYFYARTIDELLDATIAEAEAKAKIDTFLPITVEREVSEILEERAEAKGRSGTARPEVLPAYNPNPLTGLEKDAGYPYGKRPVAVMVFWKVVWMRPSGAMTLDRPST